MANVTINALPVASTIDGALDLLPIYTASSTSTQAISRNTLLGLASAPVGLTDSQTLTNKILTSPTISGPTLSGTLAGTYTIGGTPTFPASVVQLASSQTLTNKILTSPTINSPTITNATLSADTITGFSTSNSGTIYGMSVTLGVLASAALLGSVNTAALQSSAVTTSTIAAQAVTASKLQFGTLYRRQGGTTGAASWYTGGTSNTDTSSTAVFIQSGSLLVNANPTTLTFPVAFNQVPVVLVTTATSASTNVFMQTTAVTASTASVRAVSTANTIITTETAFWVAIGQ